MEIENLNVQEFKERLHRWLGRVSPDVKMIERFQITDELFRFELRHEKAEDEGLQVLTKCPNEPMYGHHVTNGTGPAAVCVHCGLPVSQWWENADAEPTSEVGHGKV